MSSSNSIASYSAEEVDITIVPAGLGQIEIKAKGAGVFLNVSRLDPAQFRTTGLFGHQVTTRSAERAKRFTITTQASAPENALLRALEAVQDSAGQPVLCSIIAREPNGRKVLWTMPAGVHGDYPDEDFSQDDGELAWGFTGIAEQAPLA